MSTETLRPNADVFIQWTPDVNSYTYVDEAVADEDATYLFMAALATEYKALFDLPAHSGTGTINSVKVYVRCKTDNGSGLGTAYCKAGLKTGGTEYWSSAQTITTSYANYSQQWNQNPKTSAAWTWDDIDALQIGVIGFTDIYDEYYDTNYCTQVYVEVDYTAGAIYTYTYTENIKLTDSVVKTYQQIRSETIKLADTITKTLARTFDDGIRLTDAVNAFKAILLTVADNIKVSDTLERTYSKVVSDTIKLSDTLVKTVTRVFMDTIKLADSVGKTIARAFTDGIKLADSVAKTIARTFADAIKISDILKKLIFHLPSRILNAIRNLPSIREEGIKR